MSENSDSRKRPWRPPTYLLVSPFLLFILFFACFVSGIAWDKKIERSLDKLLKDGIKEALKPATPWDRSIEAVNSAFSMSPKEDGAFRDLLKMGQVPVDSLRFWLNKKKKAFDLLSTLFPSDPLLESKTLSLPVVMLNSQHDPSVISKAAQNMIMLAQIECLLRKPGGMSHFLSIIRYGLVAGRGYRGRLRLVNDELTNTILFAAYGHLIELQKRRVFTLKQERSLLSRLACYRKYRLSDSRYFHAECERRVEYLRALRRARGWQWWIPSLALIGDPIRQLSQYSKDVCRILENVPPPKAVKELTAVEHDLRNSQFASSSAVKLIPSLNKLYESFIRGRSAGLACELVAEILIFKYTQNRLPKTLDELARSGVTIPSDPVTGKSFIYRPKEETFLLYSVDFDGEDQGGDPKLDMVFTSTLGPLEGGRSSIRH